MHRPILEARNVLVRRNGTLLIRDTSLDIASGESVLLVGANGSGKSSLLEVLAGLRPPDAGAVVCRGTRELFNLASLWPIGDRSLGALAEERQGFASALDTLSAAGVTVDRERLAGSLSPGETQKLLLGLAAFSVADVVLLDAPTSLLDTEGLDLFFDVVDAHTGHGRSIVIATTAADIVAELTSAAIVTLRDAELVTVRESVR